MLRATNSIKGPQLKHSSSPKMMRCSIYTNDNLQTLFMKKFEINGMLRLPTRKKSPLQKRAGWRMVSCKNGRQSSFSNTPSPETYGDMNDDWNRPVSERVHFASSSAYYLPQYYLQAASVHLQRQSTHLSWLIYELLFSLEGKHVDNSILRLTKP